MIRMSFLSDDIVAQKYIDGVLRLKDPGLFPWTGGLAVYDFFVFWHARTMMTLTPPSQNDRNAAHSGPVFLPWHRYMLLQFEEWLKEAVNDENYRLPYWDWTQDAELVDPSNSAVWQVDRLGRFEQDDFRVRVAMNGAGQLVRVDRLLQRQLGFIGELPSRNAVRAIIENHSVYDVAPFNSDSAGFRNHVEGWEGAERIHNNVHVWVGGDMQLAISPNDPAFFLHHCQVDRIWSAWQRRWSNSPYVPSQTASEDLLFHRLNDPMYTFFDEQVTPAQMLDHSASYSYDTLDDLIG